MGEVLDQPDFLNAAARVSTALEPEALLDPCKEVEARAGATRAPRRARGPSTSICSCSATSSSRTERLTLPHPR